MLLPIEYTIPILLGFLHIMVAIILLLSYRSNKCVNIFLIILLLIGALKSFSIGLNLNEKNIFISNNFNWVRLALFFAVPSSYLYIKTVIENKPEASFKDIIHFIYPIIWSIIVFIQSLYVFVPSNLWHTVRAISISSFILFYLIISSVLLRDFYKIRNQDSNQTIHFDSVKNWDYTFSILMALIEIRALVHFYFNLEKNGGFFFGVSITLNLLFLFYLIFKIILSPEVLFGYSKLKTAIEKNSEMETDWEPIKIIKNKIVKINHLYYIRHKPIDEYFTGKNLECLLILLDNQNTFLNINSLDAIFISEFKTSYVTLKKRRQQSLKGIKFALSYRLNIPEESIFIQSTEEIDKRIKLIKLNPEVLFEQTDLSRSKV